MSHSILEFPIRFLRWLFPKVASHYPFTPRYADAYEHFWTGFICCAVFSFGALFIDLLLWGIVIAAILHIGLKEVICDAKKRITPEEKQTFYVDLIVRTAGFVAGIPFIVGYFLLKG